MVELASNLTWLALTLALACKLCWAVRRGDVKLKLGSSLGLALLIGFILLPSISVSDDLLESRQSHLPPAAQTYRIATQDAFSGVELLPIFGTLLVMILCLLIVQAGAPVSQWNVRPLASRLTRSQRLRPPPSLAY